MGRRDVIHLRMQVLLDGHDIWSLDLAWYRSHVGLVSQVGSSCTSLW